MRLQVYITRHPATSWIFCALQHCHRCLLEGWKRFFLKRICFFIIFSNFSNFNFFLIFAKKTSKIRWKNIFKKKISFETHSRKNLPPVAILKNSKIFFKKKPIYFSKKPQFLNVLRILSISVAFYGKFATMWWKNNFTFRSEQKCRCWRKGNCQTSGKKTSEIPHLRGRFCFHIFIMVQNYNEEGEAPVLRWNHDRKRRRHHIKKYSSIFFKITHQLLQEDSRIEKLDCFYNYNFLQLCHFFFQKISVVTSRF